ncbi:MAG: hypothetical protein GC134_03255 [Proteobacteria bacterium]|nr:hypothetical protein [Pseudomonadota bacterium]
MTVITTTFVSGAPHLAASQTKFFSTSTRGGAEGAKSNAEITALNSENARMNACTAQGHIYAPTNPASDAGGCIAAFTVNAVTGNATLNGQGRFNNGINVPAGGAAITGNTALNNNLSVGGTSAFTGAATFGSTGAFTGKLTVNNAMDVTGATNFNGNMRVAARMTSDQLYVGNGNIGNVPTCTGDKKIQWTGTAWSCVDDALGATAATTETDPQVGTLVNGRLCRSNGTQVLCDATVPDSHAYVSPPACGTAQKLRWTGSTWECLADAGLLTEDDPQVGTLSNGKWCRTNGVQVLCDQNAPTAGTPCSTSNVSWGSGCGARIAAAPDTASNFADDLAYSECSSGWAGSAIFRCDSGVWTYASGSCTHHNADRSCRSCFAAGAMVLMADGSNKSIEDVQVGELLMGGDGKPTRVAAFDRPMMEHKDWDHQRLIAINGGEAFITNNHPVLTTGGWAALLPRDAEPEAWDILQGRMRQLKVGDDIALFGGKTLKVNRIDIYQHQKDTRLYNFVLEGNPVYYVNAMAVMSFVPDQAGQYRVHLEHNGEPVTLSALPD